MTCSPHTPPATLVSTLSGRSGTYRLSSPLVTCVIVFAALTTFGRAHSQSTDGNVAPETTHEAPTLAGLNLGDATDSEVTNRDSKLRDIEGELLKKLSLGNSTTATEPESSPLPDVRHAPSQKALHKPQATTAGKAPTLEESPQTKPTAAPPSNHTDQIAHESTTRHPRPITTVAVSTSSPSPYRRRETYAPKGGSSTDLERRLAISESQVTLLSRELESAKNRLTLSEARVAELSKQLRQSNQSGGYNASSLASIHKPTDSSRLERVSNTRPHGMPTARLTALTQLRTGPSSRESTITRLEADSTVGIERRDGSWYRVISDEGIRGWVSGRTLLFSDGNFAGSTVRIGAYRAELEASENSF